MLARLDGARTDARHRQAIEDKLGRLPDTIAGQVRTWAAVRRREGRRPHPPADHTRIRRDLNVVFPVLSLWSQDGLDLRQITTAHVTSALSDRRGHRARGVHHVLLSIFRALKQERVIFANPLTGLSLTTLVRLPEPLPSDRLRGLLDMIDSAMGRLAVGLVTVHAIKVTDVAQLPLTALDLAHATLHLLLRGQPHTVYLDTLTRRLVDDWLHERQQQWPASTNPHLLVTTHSAHHPALSPVSYCALRRAFDRTGITPARCGATECWTRPARPPTPYTWCSCSASIPAPLSATSRQPTRQGTAPDPLTAHRWSVRHSSVLHAPGVEDIGDRGRR